MCALFISTIINKIRLLDSTGLVQYFYLLWHGEHVLIVSLSGLNVPEAHFGPSIV